MVLVCYNVFGLFVQHPSWSVEGENKVSKHPVNVKMPLMHSRDGAEIMFLFLKLILFNIQAVSK